MSEFGLHPTTFVEGTNIKLEPDHIPITNDSLDGSSANFIPAAEIVKQEFIPEVGDTVECTGNQFLDFTQNEFREVKTEEVNFRPENDAVASELVAQFNPEENGVILNEEDIKEETTAQLIDSFSAENQGDFEFEEKPCQTVEKCSADENYSIMKTNENMEDSSAVGNQSEPELEDLVFQKCGEVDRNSLNESSPKISICSPLTNFAPSKNTDQSVIPKTYHDLNHIKLTDVSVALEDLFEKVPRDDSGKPAQRHINSKLCLCVFCTGKFKLQNVLEKPVQLFLNENTEELVDNKFIRLEKTDLGDEKSEQKARKNDWKTFKPFPCEKCISAFKTKKELEQHIVAHSKTGPFLCVYCDTLFNTKGKLRAHLTAHTSLKLFSCPRCDSTFKKPSDLNQHHFRIHSTARPFSCTECGSAFKTKDELARHAVSHSTEKPFSCPQCNAKFKRSRELKQHSVIHSSDTPYSCTKCPAKFKRLRDIQRHEAFHSEERPYSCAFCSLSFKGRTYLKRHLDGVHAKKIRYSCPKCPAKFKYDRSYKKHLLNVHPIKKRFQCLYCFAKFKRKANIRKHIKIEMKQQASH